MKTTDAAAMPSLVMLVYGNGGVGKTTFGATAPKPLLVDCENGSKYFALRGIALDVVRVAVWKDLEGIFEIAKSGQYKTIIIDPIGELMEKLKASVIAKGDKKNVQSDGTLTMGGWGYIKDVMKSTLKILRDSGVNLLIVAHVEEKEDEGRMVKRPKIMTKISEDLIAMVDVVGYMQVVTVEGETKRVIRVQPSDTFEAKDRTNQLGAVVPPNFQEIMEACQGTKKFAWSNANAIEMKTPAEQAGLPIETTETKPAEPESYDAPTGKKAKSVKDKLKTAGKKKVDDASTRRE